MVVLSIFIFLLCVVKFLSELQILFSLATSCITPRELFIIAEVSFWCLLKVSFLNSMLTEALHCVLRPLILWKYILSVSYNILRVLAFIPCSFLCVSYRLLSLTAFSFLHFLETCSAMDWMFMSPQNPCIVSPICYVMVLGCGAFEK